MKVGCGGYRLTPVLKGYKNYCVPERWIQLVDGMGTPGINFSRDRLGTLGHHVLGPNLFLG